MLGSSDWTTAPLVGLGYVSDPTPGAGLPASDPDGWFPTQSAWWKIRVGVDAKCAINSKATTGVVWEYLDIYVYTEDQLRAHNSPEGAWGAGDYVAYTWGSGARAEVTLDVEAGVTYYVQLGVEPPENADAIQYVLTTAAVQWSDWVQTPNQTQNLFFGWQGGAGGHYYDSGDYHVEIGDGARTDVIGALNEYLNIARVPTHGVAPVYPPSGWNYPFVEIRGRRTTETTPGQTVDDVYVGGDAAWFRQLFSPMHTTTGSLSPTSPYAPAGAIGYSDQETPFGQLLYYNVHYAMRSGTADQTAAQDPVTSLFPPALGVIPFAIALRERNLDNSSDYLTKPVLAHRVHDASGVNWTDGVMTVFGEGDIDMTAILGAAGGGAYEFLCYLEEVTVQPRDGVFDNNPGSNAGVDLRAHIDFTMTGEVIPARRRWLVPGDPIPAVDGVFGGPALSRRTFWGKGH